MALNIITVSFDGENEAITKKKYQYDKGQVCVFDDIELPDAYKVVFSNYLTGENSITMIGGENGVGVPDDFLQTGLTIYGWVYLSEGQDDGQTVKHFTIPVEKRPKDTDETPTQEEQTEIEQIIVALNDAVDKAETAAEHYPKIENEYWYVWSVADGEYVNTNIKAVGEDGTSVTASVTSITGGHRVTLTDADGEHTFDVMDGTPGHDGEDGVSPTISVSDITGGHRITITDAQGTQTVDVMDGEPGASGNGIASIAKTGTAGLVDTYTITYTNGQTTTFTVTNGSDATVTVDSELSDSSTNPVQNKVIKGVTDGLKADLNELSGSIAPVESTATATSAHAVGELFMMGETLLVALSAIAVGDTITTEGGSPNAAVTTLSSKLIKDVQVNGTSVVSQGVANVPMASYSDPGAVLVNQFGGLEIVNGKLNTARALVSETKAGTTQTKSITCAVQHGSAFYGLATASGDTTQKSSSNAVGVYTDDAKVKIQKMLGIYEAPWELIREDTFTLSTQGNIEISVDDNGQPFEITDVYSEFILLQQDVDASVASYGRVRFYNNSNINVFTLYMGAWNQASGSTAKSASQLVEQKCGAINISYTKNAIYNDEPTIYTLGISPTAGTTSRLLFPSSPHIYSKIVFEAITGSAKIRIRGKRKWS